MGLFELTQVGRINGTQRAILSDQRSGGKQVLLNSVMSWTDNYDSQITKHAVEQGAPITDNVFNNPITIAMTAILTDSFNLLTGATIANTRGIVERFNQLKKWRLDKQRLFFIYDGEIFSDLLLQFRREKSKKVGRAFRFSFDLQEIRIATAILGDGEVPNQGTTQVIPFAPGQAPSIGPGF